MVVINTIDQLKELIWLVKDADISYFKFQDLEFSFSSESKEEMGVEDEDTEESFEDTATDDEILMNPYHGME